MKGFRSPEEWKSAFLVMQDQTYSELMRSVFGNIRTPFNKHRLVEDLGAFLSRRDIQETIAAYIDAGDHRIIAAIALLNEPAPGDLESFFSGEYSYAELHEILINLEERFIVFEFQEEGLRRLALNPLLEPALAPFIADRGPLFPSVSAGTAAAGGAAAADTATVDGAVAADTAAVDGAAAGLPWRDRSGLLPAMDDRSLAALFAFVCDAPDFFKGEGGLRKRILDEGKRIFPSLDLELLAGGLRCLGLLRMEETRLCPDWGKSEIFAGLSRRERLEYWAAGICLYLRSGASARHFHRGQIQALACFIHCLMDALEPGRLFPRLTLRRIVELQEQGEPRGFRQTDSEAFLKVRDPEGFENLLEALEKTGLLIAVSPGYWQNGIGPASPGPEGSGPGASDPEPSGRKPAETGLPLIAMDTAFSCILYPEIGFAEALTLASFSSVRETGTTVRFEITRESAVRGFDRGLNAEAIVDLLTRISGKPADQNLVWTLHDWENRYSAVSLYHGTVLTLSEERRYLAETEPLLSRIDRTLAPGVYLLPAGEQDEILQNLQKAGVDIVARPPGKAAVSARTGSAGNEHSLYPPPEAAARRRGPGGGAYGQGRQSPQGAGPDPEKVRACKERFRAALEKLKLPAAEREELAARIERRLIVSESQLAGAAVRSEKLEARHLDYVGKTLVAKQAIALKAMVEVIWPGTEGETKRVLGVPETLEKTGGETVLVLKYRQGESAPQELVRIPIGKISLLRRIKKSLFME